MDVCPPLPSALGMRLAHCMKNEVLFKGFTKKMQYSGVKHQSGTNITKHVKIYSVLE